MMPILIAIGGKRSTRISDRSASMKPFPPCAACATHKAQPWAQAMEGRANRAAVTVAVNIFFRH